MKGRHSVEWPFVEPDQETGVNERLARNRKPTLRPAREKGSDMKKDKHSKEVNGEKRRETEYVKLKSKDRYGGGRVMLQ